MAEAVGRPASALSPSAPSSHRCQHASLGAQVGLTPCPPSRAQSSLLSHLYCPVGHFPLGAGELVVESGLHIAPPLG